MRDDLHKQQRHVETNRFTESVPFRDQFWPRRENTVQSEEQTIFFDFYQNKYFSPWTYLKSSKKVQSSMLAKNNFKLRVERNSCFSSSMQNLPKNINKLKAYLKHILNNKLYCMVSKNYHFRKKYMNLLMNNHYSWRVTFYLKTKSAKNVSASKSQLQEENHTCSTNNNETCNHNNQYYFNYNSEQREYFLWLSSSLSNVALLMIGSLLTILLSLIIPLVKEGHG